jgi:hypothetical protein
MDKYYYKIEKEYQNKKNNNKPSKLYKISLIILIGLLVILIKFVVL